MEVETGNRVGMDSLVSARYFLVCSQRSRRDGAQPTSLGPTQSWILGNPRQCHRYVTPLTSKKYYLVPYLVLSECHFCWYKVYD